MREPVFTETMQIGIVVRDLEATMQRYVDDYGIGPWDIVEFHPEDAPDLHEHGKRVGRSWRLASTMIGRVQWELIEPLDDESVYARFLAEKSLKFNCAYCEGFETLGPPNARIYFECYSDLLIGAERSAVDLWKWHMAEEFEHRHVAYDVYKTLYGRKHFFNAYFYRIYGFFCTMRHLGAWTAKVNAYLIGKDRESMSAAELKQSRQRERIYKRKLLFHFMPQLLRVLSPFYDPAKLRAPRGLMEFMNRVEADYGIASAGVGGTGVNSAGVTKAAAGNTAR